jgi:hypothetical protein
VSLIAVVSFKGFDSMSKLRGVRDQIISDLQDMQSWARSGKLVNLCLKSGDVDTSGPNMGICKINGDCTSSNCSPAFPPGGYGIYFNSIKRKYILFADINNNQYYNPYEKLIDSEKALPSGITFYDYGSYGDRPSYRSIGSQTYNINNFPLYIVFTANGSINILSDASPYNNIVQRIPISMSSTEQTERVYLNQVSGLIYGETDSIEPKGT